GTGAALRVRNGAGSRSSTRSGRSAGQCPGVRGAGVCGALPVGEDLEGAAEHDDLVVREEARLGSDELFGVAEPSAGPTDIAQGEERGSAIETVASAFGRRALVQARLRALEHLGRLDVLAVAVKLCAA